MIPDKLIDDFSDNRDAIEQLSIVVSKTLSELISSENIKVHSITYRVKDKASLKKKIFNKNKYKSIWDITDLSGVRVITVYEDDVDKVGELIERRFLIDNLNSVDKRELLDPDRFGYLSLHYVVSLPKEIIDANKSNNLQALRSEIQVRSLLQHSWAGIVHDLGYKSKEALPKFIWRDFYRLAGVLEVADQEFIRIRKLLKEYEKGTLKIPIEQSIEHGIDAISLISFLWTERVHYLDAGVISELSNKYLGRRAIEKDHHYLNVIINCFSMLGIVTIAEVNNFAELKRDQLFSLAKIWSIDRDKEFYFNGISIVFLCIILMLEKFGLEKTIELLTELSFINHGNVEIINKDLSEFQRKIIKT